MGSSVIYADLTFLLNFCLDFFLLFFTARLTWQKVSYWRLIGGALWGGLYSLGYIYGFGSVLFQFFGKILFSCFMLYMVFKPKGFHQMKSLMIVFYTGSFLLAGIFLVFYYTGVNQYLVHYWLFLPGFFFLFLLIRGIQKHFGGLWKRITRLRVRITLLGHQAIGSGFMDTGNGLTDPLSRQPVVVVEPDLCATLFHETGIDWQDSLKVCAYLSDRIELSERIRIIPYSSVGKKQGIMVGFRCDEIEIETEAGYRRSLPGIMAVSPYPLTEHGEYQCLVPASFIMDL